MAGIEDTPWFVGAAGVLHPAEAARAVAYAAADGSDGVIGRTDLKIAAMPTPNNRVTVNPGAVSMVNRYPGAQAQAYTGIVRVLDYLTVEPTTSAGGRSDLVVARVRDPQYGSQPGYDPANPNNFKFFSVEIMKGYASTNTRNLGDVGYPGTALARIDIPASTATITNSMIVDLREKVHTRQWRRIYPTFPTAVQSLKTNTDDWLTTGRPSVRVPDWATVCNVICHIAGAEKVVTGYVRATLKVTVGGISTGDVSITQNSPVQRFSTSLGGTVAIPSSLRGTTAVLGLRGVVAVGANGAYQIDAESGITFDIEFLEALE